jgi:hypothetical protein
MVQCCSATKLRKKGIAMKTIPPKILPWLAQKAGISLRRAEILWQAAQRHATHATGESETPAYWQAAMDRLLELVAAESLREDAASFGWRRWSRINRQAWQAPLTILDAWSVNVARSWHLFQPMRPG